jgi:hypothetical protein
MNARIATKRAREKLVGILDVKVDAGEYEAAAPETDEANASSASLVQTGS